MMYFLTKHTRKKSPENLILTNFTYGNQLLTSTGTSIIFRKSQEYYDNSQEKQVIC
ncbi:hypothetical protein LDENG_00243550 [Lucifuga dentata]|nr:hypothetical protein LDENG_00243550 [Lucifuga dentata]